MNLSPEEQAKQSFGHFLTLVKDRNDQVFLVDLTVSQFLHANKSPARTKTEDDVPQAPAKHRVMKALIQQGYVPLDPALQNLKDYFLCLSHRKTKFIKQALDENLKHTSPQNLFDRYSHDEDPEDLMHSEDALQAFQKISAGSAPTDMKRR